MVFDNLGHKGDVLQPDGREGNSDLLEQIGWNGQHNRQPNSVPNFVPRPGFGGNFGPRPGPGVPFAPTPQFHVNPPLCTAIKVEPTVPPTVMKRPVNCPPGFRPGSEFVVTPRPGYAPGSTPPEFGQPGYGPPGNVHPEFGRPGQLPPLNAPGALPLAGDQQANSDVVRHAFELGLFYRPGTPAEGADQDKARQLFASDAQATVNKLNSEHGNSNYVLVYVPVEGNNPPKVEIQKRGGDEVAAGGRLDLPMPKW
jgi:hypothetical protein